jgi:hypothetical protein
VIDALPKTKESFKASALKLNAFRGMLTGWLHGLLHPQRGTFFKGKF